VNELFNRGSLEARKQIKLVLTAWYLIALSVFLDGCQNSCFESAKAEVQSTIFKNRYGKLIGFRITLSC
jgi:hypothetical protein